MEQPTKISLLSFNLYWESNENHTEHIKTFLCTVNERKPDFVIVQNISPLFFEKLGREMNYLRYKKTFPELSGKNFLGEIIFTKKEIKKNIFIEHQKNLDHRGIFMIEMEDSKYYIGSCRFDKLNFVKNKQLSNLDKMVRGTTQDKRNIILCVDINSFDYEKFDMPENWKDTWYEYGTEKEKYTLNHEKNILCNPPNMDRPDRIWFFSTDNSIECNHFELVKNSPLSAHFGIYAIYTIT